jgi:plasmid stabilization system protein ParE
LLDEALKAIRENPRKGRARQGLPKGYKLYHAGRHFIAYSVKEETIYVARILHDQMDIARHIH